MHTEWQYYDNVYIVKCDLGKLKGKLVDHTIEDIG